jgi:hypothetical protein
MRLSDAGLRGRQTKALYPDHRLPPWLNEDAAPRSLEPIVRFAFATGATVLRPHSSKTPRCLKRKDLVGERLLRCAAASHDRNQRWWQATCSRATCRRKVGRAGEPAVETTIYEERRQLRRRSMRLGQWLAPTHARTSNSSNAMRHSRLGQPLSSRFARRRHDLA